MALGILRQKVWDCLSISWKCRVNTAQIEQCVLLHTSVSHWTDEHKKSTLAAPWSVLFFGTDEYALQSLKTLNHQYKLKKWLKRLEVVTAYKGQENAVIHFAKANGITIHAWPPTISLSEFDIGLVVSFGHMIPATMINSFPLGMLNVHASLLPKWRGAAPVVHALKNGDTHTGVTVIKIMPDKFDIGDVLAQEETSIHPDETMPELYVKLANMGGNLLMKTIQRLPDVLQEGQKQNDAEATYARKLTANAAVIKWESMNAKNVYDLQRAFTGLYPPTTIFQDSTIKLLGIRLCNEPSTLANLPQNQPGYVIYSKKEKLLMVQCKGNSWISIDRVIMPCRKSMSATDFRNGYMANKMENSVFFK